MDKDRITDAFSEMAPNMNAPEMDMNLLLNLCVKNNNFP